MATATQSLRQAVDLDPTHLETLRLLCEVLLRRAAYSEVVRLIENAQRRGVEDPHLRLALDRTRDVLAKQRAKVGERGMGSMTVSGQMERDDAVPQASHGARKKRRASEANPVVVTDGGESVPQDQRGNGGAENAGVGVRASGQRGAAPADWSDIDGQWEDVLDAHGGDVPDPISDVSEPFTKRPSSIDVELPPLSDPLADGMPPVPEDHDKTLVGGAEADESAEDSRATEPAGIPASDARAHDSGLLLPGITETKGDLEGDASRSRRQSQVSSLFAGNVASAHGRISPPTPSAVYAIAEAQTTMPPEDLLRQMVGQHDHRFDPVHSEDASDRALAAAEFAGQADKGVRRGLWVLVAVAATCAAALAIAGFLYFRRQGQIDAARRLLQQVRTLSTSASLKTALDRLDKTPAVKSASDVVAEVELLRAIVWLLEGTADGKGPPSVGRDGGTWAHVAARAVLYLAAGNSDRALERLRAARPDTAQDRALNSTLQAWVAWQQGRASMAMKLLDQVLSGLDLLMARLLRGHIYWERGDFGQAEVEYRSVLRMAPGQAMASAGLAAALLAQGKDKGLDRLLAFKLDSAPARMWQGLVRSEQSWLKTGDGAVADAIQRAASDLPQRRELLIDGVRVLARVCRFEQAEALLRRLRRAGGDTGARVLAAEIALRRGAEAQALQLLASDSPTAHEAVLSVWANFWLGKFRKAASAKAAKGVTAAQQAVIAALRKPTSSVARLRKGAPETRLALVRVLRVRGARKAALALATELTKIPGVSARAWSEIAAIHRQQGAVGDALKAARRAVQHCPGFIPAEEEMGLALVVRRDFKCGLKRLELAYRAGLRTPTSFAALARATAALGQVDAASRWISEAAQARVADEKVKLARAELALARGRPKSVLALLEASRSDFPVLVLRGRAYMDMNQLRDAEDALLDALQIDPKDPFVHLLLGVLLHMRGKAEWYGHLASAVTLATERYGAAGPIAADAYSEMARVYLVDGRQDAAMSFAERAVQANPHSGRAHRMLAQCYLSREWHKKAVAELKQAVSLNPMDARSFFLLGVANKGNAQAAIDAYEQYLKLVPRGHRAKKVRRKLRRLRAAR